MVPSNVNNVFNEKYITFNALVGTTAGDAFVILIPWKMKIELLKILSYMLNTKYNASFINLQSFHDQGLYYCTILLCQSGLNLNEKGEAYN